MMKAGIIPLAATVIVLCFCMIALQISHQITVRSQDELIASQQNLIDALNNKANAFENLSNEQDKLIKALKGEQ